MPVSSSAAKVPRLGQIDCWIGLAGVAQSVAQLSCKQQVRGSSPLASSTFGLAEVGPFHESFT